MYVWVYCSSSVPYTCSVGVFTYSITLYWYVVFTFDRDNVHCVGFVCMMIVMFPYNMRVNVTMPGISSMCMVQLSLSQFVLECRVWVSCVYVVCIRALWCLCSEVYVWFVCGMCRSRVMGC